MEGGSCFEDLMIRNNSVHSDHKTNTPYARYKLSNIVITFGKTPMSANSSFRKEREGVGGN